MNSTQTSQTPLTEEQKRKIWYVIYQDMQPDDRHPREVILDEPYNGDEEKYLRDIIRWHNIAL